MKSAVEIGLYGIVCLVFASMLLFAQHQCFATPGSDPCGSTSTTGGGGCTACPPTPPGPPDCQKCESNALTTDDNNKPSNICKDCQSGTVIDIDDGEPARGENCVVCDGSGNSSNLDPHTECTDGSGCCDGQGGCGEFECDLDDDSTNEACASCPDTDGDGKKECLVCDTSDNQINEKDTCDYPCDLRISDEISETASGAFGCHSCDFGGGGQFGDEPNGFDEACPICDSDGDRFKDSCNYLYDKDGDGTNESCYLVTLTVENGLTECMEGRTLTFTATASSNYPAGFGNPITFDFFYFTSPTTFYHATETSWDHIENHDFTAVNVPDGDSDHKVQHDIYTQASNDGVTQLSNHILIDVYELWIKLLQDSASGKSWKVVVGKSIEYEAIASSDCVTWLWSMPDGNGKWNPSGTNTKIGSMTIPFSDLGSSSSPIPNSQFGDTYGTIKVRCRDGDGNWHEFLSTQMNPPQKAKVFFQPDLNVAGGQPSTSDPPAWFLFWKQTSAGSSILEYDHSWQEAGYTDSTWIAGVCFGFDPPTMGRKAGGPSTTRVLGDYVDVGFPGGPNLGGAADDVIYGIDVFFITTQHEMKHYADNSAAYLSGYDGDGDLLIGSLEGDTNGDGVIGAGETSPNNPSTWALSTGDNDAEYQAYWMECHVWHQYIGTFDSEDWAMDGRQW